MKKVVTMKYQISFNLIKPYDKPLDEFDRLPEEYNFGGETISSLLLANLQSAIEYDSKTNVLINGNDFKDNLLSSECRLTNASFGCFEITVDRELSKDELGYISKYMPHFETSHLCDEINNMRFEGCSFHKQFTVKYNEQVYDKLMGIVCNDLIFSLERDEYNDVYRDGLRDGTIPDYEMLGHLHEQLCNGELSREESMSLLYLLDGKTAKENDDVSIRLMDIAYDQLLSPEALDEDEYKDLYLDGTNPGKILDYDTFDELRDKFLCEEMTSEQALSFLQVVDMAPEKEADMGLSDLSDALSDLESQIKTEGLQL